MSPQTRLVFVESSEYSSIETGKNSSCQGRGATKVPTSFSSHSETIKLWAKELGIVNRKILSHYLSIASQDLDKAKILFHNDLQRLANKAMLGKNYSKPSLLVNLPLTRQEIKQGYRNWKVEEV